MVAIITQKKRSVTVTLRNSQGVSQQVDTYKDCFFDSNQGEINYLVYGEKTKVIATITLPFYYINKVQYEPKDNREDLMLC